MPADASIYSMIKPPVQGPGPLDQYGQALQLKTLMGQQDLQDLQRQELTRGIESTNSLRALFANGAKPTDEQILAIDPVKAGPAILKNRTETEKAKGDITKTNLDNLKTSLTIHRDQLANVNDPQTAAQWVIAGFNDPILSPLMQRAGSPQNAISKIPQDPAAFQQWKMQNGLGIEKVMEMTAPKMAGVNNGKQNVLRETNPLAPGFTNTPITMTTTPGEDLTNERAISEGRLNRGNALAIANKPVWDSARGGFVEQPGIGGGGGVRAPAGPAVAPVPGAASAGVPAPAGPRFIQPTGLPPNPAEQSGIVTNEGKLRDDYFNASKGFVQVRDAHQRVLESAKDPSAAGDLALIFNYMKVLDPGSTVREGEFATAQNSGGISERIRSQYNKAINGERLSDNIRTDFVDRSGRLYKAAEENQKEIEKQYSDIATRSKLNPLNVVTPQRVKEAAPTPTKPPAKAGKGGGIKFLGFEPS